MTDKWHSWSDKNVDSPAIITSPNFISVSPPYAPPELPLSEEWAKTSLFGTLV